MIAVTVSLIITGAIAGTLIAILSNFSVAATRFGSSDDAQLVTTWLTADIESAGPAATNVIVTSYNPCGVAGGGSNVVTFSWLDDAASAQTDYATYWLTGTTLTRDYCTITGAVVSAIAPHTVGRSVVAGRTSVSVSGTTAKVAVTIGEPDTNFTISATRRTVVYLAGSFPTSDNAGTTLATTSIAVSLLNDPCTLGCGSLKIYVTSAPPGSAPSGSSCPTGFTQLGSTIAVTGSGTYHSTASFTPASNGYYYWYATYSGDVNTYSTALTTACPAATLAVLDTSSLSVSATAVMILHHNATVTATLSATPSVPTPTGTVTFWVYDAGVGGSAPSYCSGAGWTSAAADTLSGTLTLNLTYEIDTAGNYFWYITYSGDSATNGTQTVCPPAAETVVDATSPQFSISSSQSFSSFPATVNGGAVAGYASAEVVTIQLDTGAALPTSPATLTADASGAVTGFTVSVPAGLVGGSHTLTAVGSLGDVATSNAFTINPSVTVTAGQTFASLPATLLGGRGVDLGASEAVSVHLDTAAGALLTTSPASITTTAAGATGAFTVSLPGTLSQGSHTIVVVGGTSGLSATSNAFTVTSAITSITSANGGGGTVGKLNSGDTITVTFSGQINAASVCSAWTNGSLGTQTASTGSEITVTNPDSDNILSFTTPPSTCPAFNLGSIDLGSAGYVTSTGGSHKTAKFGPSTISYDGTTHQLVITLGTQGGSGTTNVVPSSQLNLTLSSNVVSTSNSALATYSATSTTSEQF